MSVSAQLELSEEFYPNGNPFYKGYFEVEQMENGGASKIQRGLWQHWYEDGTLNSEVFYEKNNPKFINIWLSDGTQVLKNGEGYMASVFSFGGVIDSTVTMVKDSLPNGSFKRYRRSEEELNFKLCSEGNNLNGKINGEVWFKNHKLDIYTIENYLLGKKNGKTIRKDKDIIIYEGFYCMDKACGEWKYYKNGVLDEIRSFKDGKEQGKYLGFYKNGQIKIEGNYVRHTKLQEVALIDMETHKEEIIKKEMETSAKNGTWKSYNKNGQLKKVEIFEFGKLIRSN